MKIFDDIAVRVIGWVSDATKLTSDGFVSVLVWYKDMC